MQNKIIIPGKVDHLNHRNFRVRKDKASEIDATIKILNDSGADNGSYEVEKLSIDGLPEKMDDGTPIRWLNNFAIKKNGQYIKQRYTVTIAGLSSATSKVVIIDGTGKLYYYAGTVANDTIELTDGDPGTGHAP
jgi:hypothetical protein